MTKTKTPAPRVLTAGPDREVPEDPEAAGRALTTNQEAAAALADELTDAIVGEDRLLDDARAAIAAVDPKAKAPESSPKRGGGPLGLLFAALARATARAERVGMDRTNREFDYRYASAEAIFAVARTALAAEGLTVIIVSHRLVVHEEALRHDLGRARGQDYYPGTGTLLRTAMISHASGAWLEVDHEWPILPEPGRKIDKSMASADTSGLAYFYRDLLVLPRVEEGTDMDHDARDRANRAAERDNAGDDDGNNGNGPDDSPARFMAGLFHGAPLVDSANRRAYWRRAKPVLTTDEDADGLKIYLKGLALLEEDTGADVGKKLTGKERYVWQRIQRLLKRFPAGSVPIPELPELGATKGGPDVDTGGTDTEGEPAPPPETPAAVDPVRVEELATIAKLAEERGALPAAVLAAAGRLLGRPLASLDEIETGELPRVSAAMAKRPPVATEPPPDPKTPPPSSEAEDAARARVRAAQAPPAEKPTDPELAGDDDADMPEEAKAKSTQMKKIRGLLDDMRVSTDTEKRRVLLSETIGRDLKRIADLTYSDAEKAIAEFEAVRDELKTPPAA